MNTKFKNFNIGFMEYLDDTPNLKDSPNYAAIIGSDNNRGFCSNTNNGALTNCSGSGIWNGIKTNDKTETGSKIVIDKSNPTKFTCEGGNCCHSSTTKNVQSFHKVNGILQCQNAGYNLGHKCNDDFKYTACNLSHDSECIPGVPPSNLGDFCIDCGKDKNCSGNGICQEGHKCLCNPGYFGVHCEKKNCDTLPKGDCSYDNIYGLRNGCNIVPAITGCSIEPKLGPEYDVGDGVTKRDCTCEVSGSPRGKLLLKSTDCWCKLPDNHPLRNPHDKGLGQTYWKQNATHGGTNSNWDAICKQNYGPGAYSPGGNYRDCGHDCGHPYYTSSVPCYAPAGSNQNIPWAYYQGYAA